MTYLGGTFLPTAEEQSANALKDISNTLKSNNEYQTTIDELKNQNLELTKEKDLFQNKYQSCLKESLNYTQNIPSSKILFLESIISYQGLIFLMGIIIVGLTYLLFKNKIKKK